MSDVPAVRFNGVSKRFGQVFANRDITFDIASGSIHALIGENGAGKSTVMKILFGFYQADAGSMDVGGRAYRPNDPTDAVTAGIGMVHQHFMLIPTLTVIENIILGYEDQDALGRLELTNVAEKVRAYSEAYGMPIDPFEQVSNLTIGQKQRVEIIKALFRGADILILDEPTAVLTPNEVLAFFDVLRRLKNEHKTVVLITHKLEEVLAVSDRITVMRNGQVVGETAAADASVEKLAGMMVGREFLVKTLEKKVPGTRNVLTVQNISCTGVADHAVENISFTIAEGEIFGIAGVSGNGQTTLEEALNGTVTVKTGDILLHGESIVGRSVRERKAGNIAHIPSDREKHGFIGSFSNEENLYIGYHFLAKFSNRAGFLKRDSIRSYGGEMVTQFDIRPPNLDLPTGSLSGGNKQKVVIAREFSQEPDLLIVAEPTRGVDIGAIETIHAYILKLKEQGKAILLISSELSEICALSDRACVMYKGSIADYFNPDDFREDEVGMLMSGSSRSSV